MEDQGASDAMDDVCKLANILNVNLSREALSLVAALCEEGVNPEGLAAVINEMGKESNGS
eukprot:CAMPEP_0201522594 /NCGR_PEP_ID=MMETSP0161_2-20130828/18306_1 /ASSEMBLY_ACC=CAM_ASM_000251 /TAXON_ID=180227 /ORGANISM="Neoparamoeba aestuarina, Strain SoJaBio B1-5/56/2" /LENGTH=59 /DNA_ID=CAMNT_0047921493 /DNA_START=65 /DNA_END=244 /DNA_ORIENTATION=+